jgi:glucose/arabinose dehydrogenase
MVIAPIAGTGLGASEVATTTKLLAGFEEIMITDDLNGPTAMEFSPDGRLFVAEQTGQLRVIKNGRLLSTPFLTVPTLTTDLNERGLLGLALDPHFENNGHVYVYYTRTDVSKNRLSRFTASATNPDVADPNSEFIILDNLPANIGHNGGPINFADDGTLFLPIGDVKDPANGQSLTTFASKILRINTDGSVPPDNPFVNDPVVPDEVWALGLRHPFKADIDEATGRFYINDTGSNSWEEINEGSSGANYGWPTCEGLSGTPECQDPSFEDPIFAYPHTIGCAITGGTFYQGTQFPEEYRGSYFFADYCASWIKVLKLDNSVMDFVTNTPVGIDDLAVGPDGALYYMLFDTGEIYMIRFVTDNRSPNAVASANPTSGLAPLTVQLSAEGSTDPDQDDTLIYNWNFGDGSPIQQGLTVNHTYQSNGAYRLQLTVDDQNGGTGTASKTILVGNGPTARITSPAVGATFNAGTTVNYQGEATDPEDGVLSDSVFSWTVVLHHHPENDPLHHTHPYTGQIVGVTSGSFDIPPLVHDYDIWFRVHLRVTDADGLFDETSVDIFPNTSTTTFNTVPPGLAIKLDGQPRVTPVSEKTVVGASRAIEAPSPQFLNGKGYVFDSWSDGGTPSHVISTREDDTVYTATFVVDPKFDDTLVGYWSLDDGSGTTATDLSGYGNHGILENGPTWVSEGRVNGAISFNGNQYVNHYISLPATPSLDVTGDITLAAWIKTKASGMVLIGGYQASGSSGGYGLGIGDSTDSYGGHNNKLVYWSGAQGIWVAGTQVVNDGTWHHVAVVISGDTTTFYLDGGLDSSVNAGGPTSYRGTRAIGARSNGKDGVVGMMDEVYIFNRALNGTEILSLYKNKTTQINWGE